jgi:hypothetical protein
MPESSASDQAGCAHFAATRCVCASACGRKSSVQSMLAGELRGPFGKKTEHRAALTVIQLE